MPASRFDFWIIQNGSYRLSGAIFPNGEVHHGGLRGHSHSLDPNEPTLRSQFFCHPANMSLRAGQSTRLPLHDSRKAAGARLVLGLHVPADRPQRMGESLACGRWR